MATFNDLWQLLYDHGSSNYYKYDCNKLWNELTPQQQQRLYNNISDKIKKGKYVAYNPLDAIHDNRPCRRLPTIGQPTNLNGAGTLPNEPLVIAKYNGVGGLYTRREAELFGMEILQDFN